MLPLAFLACRSAASAAECAVRNADGTCAAQAAQEADEEVEMRTSLLQSRAGQQKALASASASVDLEDRRAKLLNELREVEQDLLLSEDGAQSNATRAPKHFKTRCSWTAGCGKFNQWDSCHCNEDCKKFNSCCEDIDYACSRSCANTECGGFVPGASCQCNAKCAKFNSCCDDYDATCLTTTTTTTGPCTRVNCNDHGEATGITPNCECTCDAGFLGDSCEKEYCDASDCNNRGTGSGVRGDCTCKCEEGFSGDKCEHEVCNADDCNNHGTGTGIRPNCKCECENGWAGPDCKQQECTDAEDCNEHGIAFGIRPHCQCSCAEGWVGKTCNEVPCDAGDCNNHGKARGNKPNCQCHCDKGWGGDKCELEYCTEADCHNHGRARGFRPNCQCGCWREWEGEHCETHRKETCKELGCGAPWKREDLCHCHKDCIKHHNCCKDFITECLDNFYSPPDKRLLQPSNGKKFTFYAYRAQDHGNGHEYPLENVNLASMGGVLWYLHNEIINTCWGAGSVGGSAHGGTGKQGDRKFAISRIRRLKITYKATTPLLEKGMNFGPLCSYDAGECTGPHKGSYASGVGSGWASNGEWNEYGYIMGCGKIGEWPHQHWTSGKKYPNAAWYSVAGRCPSLPFNKVNDWCKVDQPGGVCSDPTGAGNCTYSYEEAGEIDLDELVGIKPKWPSRQAFCKQCGSEGSAWSGGGCGLQFWGHNIWDEKSAKEQVQKALDMFHDKYPDMPKQHDMPEPPCDFNRVAYGMHA
eukprot:TRINITY_DN5534_c0_g3_i3.p1 TRINITY_DN5534_c0_g3~~TRINITY_DN5534_c0_g3_i3.p1  ORF type:complete len:754 (-),score=179.00 TRINITY_DN5534_c0_g3_i3:449-2710(-)